MSSTKSPTVVLPKAPSTVVPETQSELKKVVVEVPIPVAPKSSVNFKIDDVDGQRVTEWFRDDFGANNSVEFGPKLKSNNGYVKGKVTIKSLDSIHIDIVEEIEVQTKIDNRDALFKIKPKEISGHFDLGFSQAGNHWFNPYFVGRIPRFGNCLSKSFGSTLGFVFHHDQSLSTKFRSIVEFGFKSPSDPAKSTRTEFDIKTNLSLAYRQFIVGYYESWNLTNQFLRTSKLSFGVREDKFNGFIGFDLKNDIKPTAVHLGLNLAATSDIDFFLRGSKGLEAPEKPASTTPTTAEPIDISLGVGYQHYTGFSSKVAYHHLNNKLQGVFNFAMTKNFTASVLLDHVLCSKAAKGNIQWGLKAKLNA